MAIPVFTPYDHQREALSALGRGYRRACWVWHRRAGKDMAAFLGWMVPEALRKTGTYYYIFPTYSQGKKIIWDGIDNKGIPLLHYIGGALGLEWDQCKDIVKFNESELQITLPVIRGGSKGSIIQIIGVENIDRVVGTNPIGVIFSEYALQKPQCWSYLRPILEANGGWAIFVFTPRGQNHAFTLWQEATKSKDWSTSLKTIKDTYKGDGSPIISMAQIEQMRAEGEDEDLIQQEYFCSFAGAQSGSYYSHLVQKAQEEGRVRPGLFDPNLPVDTFWDIGQADTTVIGFRQVLGSERRWINCYENSGQGLDHYASILAELARVNNYRYRHHYFPHDMKVTEFTTGEARIVAARRLGIRPCSVVPKRPLYEGIDAVRRAFSHYWFDSNYAAKLLVALATYHRKWDKEGRVFSELPDHDWTSHYADMVRYEAIVGDNYYREELDLPEAGVVTFDPLTYNENIPRWDVLSKQELESASRSAYY